MRSSHKRLLTLLALVPATAGADPYRTVVAGRRGAEGRLRAATPGAVEVIEVGGDARGRGVADVLAEAAGVQVHAFGGLGRFAQVTLRGSGADQVAIYLDGVPISRAAGGAFNLADVPLAQVERIEVFRGALPVWLPGAPAGGAINLVTRTPIGRRRVEAEVGGGSFGARGVRALGQWADEDLVLTTFADYQGAEGDFAFDSDHGTPLNPDDDRSARRRNSGFDEVAAHSRAELTLARGWRVIGAMSGVRGARELPQIGALNQPLEATLRNRRADLSVDLTRGAGPSLGADVSLSAERFADEAGAVGLGERKDVEGRTWSVGLRGRRTFEPVASIDVDALLAARWERYVEVGFLPAEATSDPSERGSVDATLALEWAAPDSDLRVAPQLRVGLQRDRFVGRPSEARALLSPALTLRADWLRATVWRGVRAPAFFELFGDRGAVSGNPALTPERVLGAEMGATLQGTGGAGRWRAFGEAVGFAKRVEDLIQLRQASAMSSRAFNVGQADLAGVELRGRLRWGPWLDLAANYTYQRAVDAGDVAHTRGRPLPRRPEHEVFVRPRVRVVADRLTVTPRLSYTSGTFLDPANLLPTPARTLLGLEADLTLGGGVTLTLTGENLLDQATEDFQGYPLPGRSAFASLRWRWIGGAS